MASGNATVLTAQGELELRQAIDEYIGSIQAKIDALRVDGTDKVLKLQSDLESLKRDRIYTPEEKKRLAAQRKAELKRAKSVENARTRRKSPG